MKIAVYTVIQIERRTTVNQDILKGQWRQMQGEAKKAFGKLTDDDMTTIGGHIDSFIGKVQERYGYTREQASDQVRRFADNFRNDYPDTWDSWYGNGTNGMNNEVRRDMHDVDRTVDNIQEDVRQSTRNF